jgi:outer membrane protein assembly factor BamB
MAWHTPRRSDRDTPSPIVIDGYIVVVDLKGTATCYERDTGHELWKERICSQITSSPIAAAGLAYFQDERGETVVVKPGPKLEVVARNDLGNAGDEIFRASLTPVNGKMFARSNQTLYCISAERSTGR